MTGSINPGAVEFVGSYFDGDAPLRRDASLRVRSDYLDIELDTGLLSWPLGSVKVVADGRYGEPTRVEYRGGRLGECIETEDRGFLFALEEYAPKALIRNFLIGDLQGWSSVIVAAMLILSIVVITMTWVAPAVADYAALWMPRSAEEQLGHAVIGLLAPESGHCTHAKRRELLDGVANRLAKASGSEYELKFIYTSNPMANAFAAPGGYIVVYRGLLEAAETPEELAGVIAHEISHVNHRHSTRALMRHVSAQTLLRLMAMDSAGTPTAMAGAVDLGSLAHRRGDEEQADREAVALLARAGISPKGLSTFFRRLDRRGQGRSMTMTYFSSHPALYERASYVDKEAEKYAATASSLMTDKEWTLVKNTCMAD